MLTPLLVLLVAFSMIPIGYGFVLSATNSTGASQGSFVGMGNYRTLMHDAAFWRSALVTLYYLLMTVPAELILGLALALAVNQVRRRSYLMLIFFLPQVTSLVAIGMVARWVFRSDPTDPANRLAGLFGIHAQDWLGDPEGIFQKIGTVLGVHPPVAGPSLALVVISIFTVWYYSGFHMVIFTSGLTSIPPDVYEAAILDGANVWQRFRFVTLRLLSPTTYFLLVISVIGSLQSFTLVFAVGGASYSTAGGSGGPVGTTRVLTLYIFDNFFNFGRTGYAMACAVVLFVMVLVATLLQRFLAERRVHYLQ